MESVFEPLNRPLVKSAYQKINFLISQPKHMLWVLKRMVSYVQTDGLENFYNFMLKNYVYLNLWLKFNCNLSFYTFSHCHGEMGTILCFITLPSTPYQKAMNRSVTRNFTDSLGNTRISDHLHQSRKWISELHNNKIRPWLLQKNQIIQQPTHIF